MIQLLTIPRSRLTFTLSPSYAPTTACPELTGRPKELARLTLR
ncbi:hypothetical protein [Thermococcus sp.]